MKHYGPYSAHGLTAQVGGPLGYATQNRANIPTPEPQESPSRIRDGITNTEQALSAIHEAISALEKRFDTVLRPMPPSTLGNANAAQSGPVGSHLTGRIGILNEGFQQALSRLHELAARAEPMNTATQRFVDVATCNACPYAATARTWQSSQVALLDHARFAHGSFQGGVQSSKLLAPPHPRSDA